MNESDWLEVASEVQQGLIEAGTTGYLIEKGQPIGGGMSPEVGPDIPHECQIVISDWASEFVAASLVQVGDRRVLVSVPGLSVTPELGMGFRFSPSGPDYQVVNPIRTVAPAGVPVLYEINVRGG